MRLTLNQTSPLTQAEYQYQQRSIDKRRHRWWVALPGTLMLTLSTFSIAFVFMLTLGESLGLFHLLSMPPEYHWLALILWLGIPGFVLIPTALVLHFGLQLRTLLWAANSVPREKLSGTWELLLLTGVSGREIVMSKWWATVRRAAPAYLRLAVMRMALVLWFAEWTRIHPQYYPTLRVDFDQYYLPMNLMTVLLAFVILLAYTFINLMVTAALGMFMAFVSQRSTINTAAAGVVRVVIFILPGIAFGMVALFIPSFLYPYGNPQELSYAFFNVMQISALTFVENGMIISYAIAQIGSLDVINLSTLYTIVGVLSITWLYYAVVAVLSLAGGRLLALRQAALKQAEAEKLKKRKQVSA